MDRKEEIDILIKKWIPEIEARFTTNLEKRNLRQFLISFGFGTSERFLKYITQKMDLDTIDEDIPSPQAIESLIYNVVGGLKPKNNTPVSAEIEGAGMKFIRVFTKIGLGAAEFSDREIKNLSNTLKMALSSMVQNDGEDPKGILEMLETNQLDPQQLLQYNKTKEQMEEQAHLETLQYNIRYELNKPGFLFNISYNEVKALADSYNSNQNELRIAGEVLKLRELSRLKIFTITDKKAFENEIHWSGSLASSAKKFYGVGTWTYERFCQFGIDVTSKFLKPISNPVEPVKMEQKVNSSMATVSLHCNQCNHNTNHIVSFENKERESVIEETEGKCYEFWIDHHFQILKCGSCNEYTYKTWQIWSEDVPDFTPSNVRILPVRGKSTIKKADAFQNVPSQIISLYNEIYQAYVNKTNLLCAGGIRAILEAICKDKGVRKGTVPAEGDKPEKMNESLKGRIYGLFENGLITKKHSEILVHHQYLGDKALHECEKPSNDELEIAIQIIEYTLNSVYELSQKGEDLKSKRQSR